MSVAGDIAARRLSTVARIEVALTHIRDCIEVDDPAGLVDWAATIQLRTVDLIETAMPDITAAFLEL